MRNSRNTAILALVLSFSCVGVFAQESLSLVTAAKPPLGSTPHYTGLLERITTEVFRRVNRKVTIQVLPGERALINVNTGIDDGDIFRAPGFEAKYPNLVRVPESIGKMEFMAYSSSPDVKHVNWTNMKNFTVAYSTGWKIYERNAKGKEITRVRSIEDLLPMLAKGRAELVLIDRWQGTYLAKKQGYSYKPLEPPLATIDMYMYMNTKHADLIPIISKALRDMKKDGTYKAIYNEFNRNL